MLFYADDVKRFICALKYGVIRQIFADNLIDEKTLYLLSEEEYE